MPSIEIPTPEFHIMERVECIPFETATQDSEQDVTFFLMFGDFPVTSWKCQVPYYDRDNDALDRRRDDFRKYVAERLSTLFEGGEA